MSSRHSSSSSLPLSPAASSSSHRVDPNKPKPFAGHGSQICSVCYSPDGRRIATGGRNPAIRIWDSYTGEMLFELRRHPGGVTSVCYSSDGQRLVSGWRDGSICVWNASDGELVWERAKAYVRDTTATCSLDNRHIASGGDNKMVRIWRTEDMTQIMETIKHPYQVDSVCFSPDGCRLATGCGDDKIRVFDVATGTLVDWLQGGWRIRTVIYSPLDGKQLASSWDNVIRVWDASTGGVLFDLTGHTLSVCCLAFSPDGKQILSGSSDHTICLWDSDKGKRIGQPVRRHAASITAASFAPDGTHFVTGAEDGSMRVWDAQTREVILPKLTNDEKERYQGPFRGHIDEINAVVYFPDGSKVASLSVDMTIRIWDVHTGEQIMEPLDGHCFSVSISSDGSRLVGRDDHGIMIWDTHTGDVILRPLRDQVLCVVVSPDDNLIAGTCNGKIILWDSQTGQQIRSIKAHDGYVRELSFSRDGTRLASGGDDMAVYVWDVSTAEIVAGPFKGHTDVVTSVAFSPDGICIVSGSEDHTLRVWNATTGAAILGPLETSSWVTSVLYSPDGTRICSTSINGMCLWNANTGDLIHGPLEYGEGITCAVYSPDGKHILIGSRDGSLRLCDAAAGEIIPVPGADSDHGDPSDSFLDLPATGILVQPQQGQHVRAPGLDWSFDLPSTIPAENNVAARTTPTTFFSFSRLRNNIVNIFQNSYPPGPNAHDQPTHTIPRPLSRSHLSFSFRPFRNPFVNTSRRHNSLTDEDGIESNWVAEARTRPIYAFQTGPLPDEIERGCFFHLASYICYGRRDPNITASNHNMTYVGSPPDSRPTASHGNVPHTYPPAPAMTTTAPTAIPSRTSHIQALLGQLFTFLRSPPRSGVSTSPSIPGATNADPVIPIVVITSPSPGAANGPSDVAAARQALAASPVSTSASVPSSDCPPSTSFITPAISTSPVRVVEPRSTSPETAQTNSATLESTSGQSSPLPVTADVSTAVQGLSTADFALQPFTPSTGLLTAAMNTPLPPSHNSSLVSESSPALDIHRASLGVNVASDTFSFDEVALVHHYRQLKVSLGIPAGGSSSSSTALLST